jgi:parallel beta-helix repeat protein
LVISLTRNVIICNNTILGGAVGVHLISANDTLVTRNTIYDTGFDAVFMDNGCSNNIITDNHFTDNKETGVMAWTGCTGNVISNNFIQYSDNGVNFLTEADGNYVVNNTIIDTTISGVSLDTVDNEVRENRILDCDGDGIRVFKPDNEIVSNQIIRSKYRGVYIGPGGNNTEVHHNSFINNTQESVLIIVASRSFVTHNDFLGESERAYASDSGYLNIFESNYWEGFLSTDEDRDGVFDTPYDIEGHAQNRDHYPVTTMNNPPPVEPDSTETTTSSSTQTSTTSSSTNTTASSNNQELQFVPIAIAVGVLIPIIIYVVYYRRK